MKKLRIGTRKSLLAQAQTRIVAEKIRKKMPELEIEIVPMATEGDKRLDKNLSSFGGKGVFTKELEMALLDGRIHMAVHSAKDMPVDFPKGLVLGAVVERAECEDMVVTRNNTSIACMKPGSIIGTGSLRRKLQLQMLNSQIETKEIRGNVQTRLKKLDEGRYDAIVLARAGIERLRRDSEDEYKDFYNKFYYEVLDSESYLPAAGQAILAVEVAEVLLKVPEFRRVCQRINEEKAAYMLQAERNFLKYIGGGCNAPAGACSWIDGEKMRIKGGFAQDGKSMLYTEVTGEIFEAGELGQKLAEKLLNKG